MTAANSFVFLCNGVEIREQEFSIVKRGEVLPVEPRAFRVLLYLLRNPQRLITKEELLQSVWGDVVVTENSLARAILKLRQCLGDDARQPKYIETVTTVGYRWVCPVAQREDLTPVSVAHEPVPAAAPDAGTAAMPALGSVPQAAPVRRWTWVLAAGAATGMLLTGGIWYSIRPLPRPRITAYIQITHDGHQKILAGTDGSRLYFTQVSPTYESPRSLAEVAATGGEIAQIPIAIPGGMFLAVDVSPDGSSSLIASAEKGNPAFAFWSARLVGWSVRRLGSWAGAVYSPDGRSVAYTTEEGDLWITGSDGSGAHKMGPVGGGAAWMPAWSPDGSAIRYLARDGRIWEIAANGSNPHLLLPGWHGADKECCGHWTPDGKFFVFVSGELWGIGDRFGRSMSGGGCCGGRPRSRFS